MTPAVVVVVRSRIAVHFEQRKTRVLVSGNTIISLRSLPSFVNAVKSIEIQLTHRTQNRSMGTSR